MKITSLSVFGASVSFLVLVVAVIALFIAGAPSTERRLRLDEQRISNLDTLRFAVIEPYYASYKRLPDTLDEARRANPYPGDVFTDPVTHAPYEYTPVPDTQNYTLCAAFDLPTDTNRQTNPTWTHSAGRNCFSFTVGDRSVDAKTPLRAVPTQD